MSDFEGTLTAHEVTAVQIARSVDNAVHSVDVSATGADIWVTTDGDPPYVGKTDGAHRVPDGKTDRIAVPPSATPLNPVAVVKMVSAGAAAYTVTGVPAEDASIAEVLAASGKGFVNHAAAAGTARPTGYASIEWYGSVEPTNAADGDTWVETA